MYFNSLCLFVGSEPHVSCFVFVSWLCVCLKFMFVRYDCIALKNWGQPGQTLPFLVKFYHFILHCRSHICNYILWYLHCRWIKYEIDLGIVLFLCHISYCICICIVSYVCVFVFALCGKAEQEWGGAGESRTMWRRAGCRLFLGSPMGVPNTLYICIFIYYI